MDSVTILGNVALVCTIACNFSGLPICVDFFKKRSTANFSVIPFLANTTCNALWLQYGIVLGDRTIQTLNFITVFLQVSYVVCFYINTIEKAKVQKLSLLVITFLLSIYTYAIYIADASTAKTTLGLSASAASILSCAAPFENLAEVIKTRNSQSLPRPIIFGAFVVTTLWYFYGVLVGDIYIQVPNFIGSVLSAIQLSLIVIFPAKVSLKKDQ